MMYGDEELGILPGQNCEPSDWPELDDHADEWAEEQAREDEDRDDSYPDPEADDPRILGMEGGFCEFCGSGPTCIVCRRGLDPLPPASGDEPIPF